MLEGRSPLLHRTLSPKVEFLRSPCVSPLGLRDYLSFGLKLLIFTPLRSVVLIVVGGREVLFDNRWFQAKSPLPMCYFFRVKGEGDLERLFVIYPSSYKKGGDLACHIYVVKSSLYEEFDKPGKFRFSNKKCFE